MKIGILGLLGLIFVVAKFAGWIDWSWWLVLLPIYGSIALGLLIVVVTLVIAGMVAWLDTK